MENFRLSFFVTGICLLVAFGIGGASDLFLVAVLAILEISFSFDNAVINAAKLKYMDKKWQGYFLTWGMLVAVFGMRLIFPVLIVASTSELGFFDVFDLALNDPDKYGRYLSMSHAQISAFGGMFLLLLFLNFIFDHEKEVYWIKFIEERLSKLGKLDSIEVATSLIILFIVQSLLPDNYKLEVIVGGVLGITLYIIVSILSAYFEEEDDSMGNTIKQGTAMSFIYLEILDASFSFDGVVGAFAVTKDIIIIMLGLTIGAMFVRSLTVHLVKKGTLDEYIYLEHGAHYAIGALAILMLFGTVIHIPETITGLIGVVFIGLSLFSSINYRKNKPLNI